MTVISERLALVAAVASALALSGLPAQAQTADQYNRASQAIQMCSSGMGAMIPECAKLRGGLGMSVVSPQQAQSALGSLGLGGGGGLGGFGGNKAQAAVGILGALGAMRQQAAAAAPAANNAGAIQQAIAMCVQNAQGNNTAIQACLNIANAGPPAAPVFAQGQQMLPSAQRSQDSAMATYAAGQTYQACVAANPGNWQSCLQTMNNNTQTGLLNAGVSPQQLQAAGGYVPPGYAAPAPNPFGSLLPKR